MNQKIPTDIIVSVGIGITMVPASETRNITVQPRKYFCPRFFIAALEKHEYYSDIHVEDILINGSSCFLSENSIPFGAFSKDPPNNPLELRLNNKIVVSNNLSIIVRNVVGCAVNVSGHYLGNVP